MMARISSPLLQGYYSFGPLKIVAYSPSFSFLAAGSNFSRSKIENISHRLELIASPLSEENGGAYERAFELIAGLGDFERIKRFISRYKEVEVQDIFYYPLYTASKNPIEAVKYLFSLAAQGGEEPEKMLAVFHENMPMAIACANGWAEVAEFFFSKGGSFFENSSSNRDNRRAFDYARGGNYGKVLKVIYKLSKPSYMFHGVMESNLMDLLSQMVAGGEKEVELYFAAENLLSLNSIKLLVACDINPSVEKIKGEFSNIFAYITDKIEKIQSLSYDYIIPKAARFFRFLTPDAKEKAEAMRLLRVLKIRRLIKAY